jgi:hypothetical protein
VRERVAAALLLPVGLAVLSGLAWWVVWMSWRA